MNNTKQPNFELENCIHQLKHYLPSQMTLKDFIHHNSLHAFQNQKFYEGIARASKIFGYKTTLQLQDYRKLFKLGRIKGTEVERMIAKRMPKEKVLEWSKKVLLQNYDENVIPRIGLLRTEWKSIYNIDLDTLVHPLLYRIVGAYIDQGISLWDFPFKPEGFLATIRYMEKNSAVSFLKTASAKKILLDESISTEDLLAKLVGKEIYFEQYLFDMCFSHRGYSGIIGQIDDNAKTLLIEKPITMKDFIHFELIMELDSLNMQLGSIWQPIGNITTKTPIHIFDETPLKELDIVLQIWQDAFEWSYYHEVFKSIKTNVANKEVKETNKDFQAIFCIDERECSLRRHIEYVAPNCETFGAPGFFGVEFYFKQQGAKFVDKLCPAPVTPKYLIKEYDVLEHKNQDIMFSKTVHQMGIGIFATLGLGLISIPKIFQAIFAPKMSPSISDAFAHMSKFGKLTIENKSINDVEGNLQIGFTILEMATRVESFLRNIGLLKNFSPNIYIMAHGSSSANNPHHGAHDCGACSGRPGSVNARVFAFMANNIEVRKLISLNGIEIPSSTVFIPAMHDTAADVIGYYDDALLSASNNENHEKVKIFFENALDLNAKERSRRFASIDTKQKIKKVRKAILNRSVSLFEPRPELGHGTNSLAIIGRREVTKGLFLDRRAFLNSYDYSLDLEGKCLANVIAPIGVVCGGINLEYYFSRVDNLKLGCGTKLPHNVIGLVGVANSSDGDLRPGLPWQMIEPHDPVRLMVIVEHYPEVLLKVIQSNPAIYEWYNNEWVHIAALHPETKEIYYLENEQFVLHISEIQSLDVISDVGAFFEKAPEMISNHITHATFENLPIYQLKNNDTSWN
jgi:uncharacterized protein